MRNLETWLEFISSQHWQTIDLGLTRMRTMVERMQLARPARRVITVAGTNGKGSTSVACEALLMHAGLRVGTTLSPHVRHFNERVRINGRDADDALLCQAFAAVEQHREELTLTYFEFSALAALWCFKQARVDVAVLEIGLGGRLDAFNVIDADVAVITSIGLDHEQFLGATREAIGAEKAGILRRGQHVALGPDMPAAVLEACAGHGLAPVSVGQDYCVEITPAAGTAAASWSIVHRGRVVAAGLPLGACAPQNLLLAFLAVQPVGEVAVDAIAAIAGTLNLPGRLQSVPRGGRNWILDVAHNPAGARFLCEQLAVRGLSPQAVVCGMLRDKDHRGVFDAVRAHFSAPWRLIDTRGERGLDAASLAAELAAELTAELTGDVAAYSTWTTLLREVDSATQPGDVILLLGSFDVIEQFELVHESAGKPA